MSTTTHIPGRFGVRLPEDDADRARRVVYYGRQSHGAGSLQLWLVQVVMAGLQRWDKNYPPLPDNSVELPKGRPVGGKQTAGNTERLGFKLPSDTADRVRRVVFWGRSDHGASSLQEWFQMLVTDALTDQDKGYPPIPDAQLPRGRRPG